MFCKQCGNEISDLSLKKCPKCNTTVGKGGRFCSDCGKKLGQGEKCSCSSVKPEKGLNKKSDVSVIENLRPNTKFQKKEEPNPTVNKRIAGNPLLEKIARGDGATDKSKEIIQEEAVKIVYGKDMTVEKLEALEKQKQKAEEKETEVEEKKVDSEVEVKKSDTAKNNAEPIKKEEIPVTFNKAEEKCDIQTLKPSEKCEKPLPKTSEKCKEVQIPVPPANMKTGISEPEVTEITRLSKPKTVLNQDTEDSKNLFPEAFAPGNMQYNHQSQAPVMHGPVSKPYSSPPVEKKKKFDGMWVAGLICSVLSLSGVKFIPFLVFFILSLLFGIIDIFLNEKKTGIGVLIGEAIIGIYFFISVLGGIL